MFWQEGGIQSPIRLKENLIKLNRIEAHDTSTSHLPIHVFRPISGFQKIHRKEFHSRMVHSRRDVAS